MRIYVSHSNSYDYVNELYKPLESNSIFREHDFFLPHAPKNISIKAKDIIYDFDLVIAEVTSPSTGQGIEIGLACAANVPVYCFCKAGAQISSSLQFYAEQITEYDGQQNLAAEVNSLLLSL
jgi:nucleoside 2-deoxyribosyltransferase